MESKQGTCLSRGSNGEPSVIEKVDKIRRTPPRPPRGRPSTKETVSSVKESKSRSNSVFRSQRTNSISSQKSNSSRRSDSAAVKKRKKDSTTSSEAESDVSNDIEKNDLVLCSICGDNFGKDDSCISCSCCQRWFHAICEELSEEEITAFKFLGAKASYFCHNCDAGAKELFSATVVLRERLDKVDNEIKTVKTNVETVTNKQKTNTTKIKTLESIHANLRKDVDNTTNDMKTAKNNIKVLQDNYESDKTDKADIKTRLKANKESLNSITTKLSTLEEDIMKKVNTLITTRLDDKLKNVNLENPQGLVDADLSSVISNKIDEKLANEDDKLHETITQKVKESVITTYNENNPTIPIADMEIDGERPNKIKVPPTFATAVQQVSTEMQEIQKRKLQLVFTNLDETGSNDRDKRAVEEILELIHVNVKIVEVMRLGKQNNEKPRVLRVSVENLADKRTILSKATSLRNIPNDHKYAYVYIKPNLTPTQQETQKNLYLQLLAVRKKHPTTKYKISRGQIVIVPNPEA